MADVNNDDILKFLEFVGHLKKLPRQGWVNHNIKNPECVASHMYRMAILTFFIGKDNTIDRDRCMKLALVHDLPECIVGDITPHCGVDPAEKHERELNAMKSLKDMAGAPGSELLELYEEYASQTTNEAKLVKELDKFDMILQAFEYEKDEDRPQLLQQFFDSAGNEFSNPVIKSLVAQLTAKRKEFEKSNS